MRYTKPVEVIPYDMEAADLQTILNNRFEDWWVLERVIECTDAWVYYFTFVGEAPTANAVPI